jgi:hypothetical protein
MMHVHELESAPDAGAQSRFTQLRPHADPVTSAPGPTERAPTRSQGPKRARWKLVREVLPAQSLGEAVLR